MQKKEFLGLQPEKQLDCVLSLFVENIFLKPNCKYPDVKTKLFVGTTEAELNSPDTHLLEVLQKLWKDGYLGFEDEYQTRYYDLTFEGRYFNKNGGYGQQSKDRESQPLSEILHNHKLRDDLRKTAIGSVVAALGAAVLVLWGISKAIYQHCDFLLGLWDSLFCR